MPTSTLQRIGVVLYNPGGSGFYLVIEDITIAISHVSSIVAIPYIVGLFHGRFFLSAYGIASIGLVEPFWGPRVALDPVPISTPGKVGLIFDGYRSMCPDLPHQVDLWNFGFVCALCTVPSYGGAGIEQFPMRIEGTLPSSVVVSPGYTVITRVIDEYAGYGINNYIVNYTWKEVPI